MARHIMKCELCGSYTMLESCSCGGKTHKAGPPKYSVPDKYARFRRQVKHEDLQRRGLL